MSLLLFLGEEDSGVSVYADIVQQVDVSVLCQGFESQNIYGPKLFEFQTDQSIKDTNLFIEIQNDQSVPLSIYVSSTQKIINVISNLCNINQNIFASTCNVDALIPYAVCGFMLTITGNQNIANSMFMPCGINQNIFATTIAISGITVSSCNDYVQHIIPGVSIQTIDTTETPDVYATTMTLLVDGKVIKPNNITLTTDDDSYCWSLTINTYDEPTYLACAVNKLITFKGSGSFPESTFVIDERKLVNTPSEGKSFQISARSITALLGDLSRPLHITWTDVMAHDVIHQLCALKGISVDSSGIPNWRITVLSADGLTPIAIIKKIADACGGILQTIQDTLVVRQKYVTPPTLWSEGTADHSILNLSSCIGMTDYVDLRDNYTEVIVTDYQDTTSFSLSFSVLEKTVTEAVVAALSYPTLDAKTIQDVVSTSHLPDGTNISYMGEFFDTVTETIEIINGKGVAPSIIFSLLNSTYKRNTDLGGVTAKGNNVVTSEIEGTSLVTLTYLTQLHKFRLTTTDSIVQIMASL